MKWGAYYRLTRCHKPVGTLLLWFPTAWALWIASDGSPPWVLTLMFALGTLVMRAAGCVINDLADRRLDCFVKRTAMRPLTTGEVGVFEALVLLSVLLVMALFIVLQLPILCLYYAMAALCITWFYPFCKRFIQAPQFVLGLAFSMGIPMVYAALGKMGASSMVVLMMLNFAWIVSYDTMYAMADLEDDLKIGIHSTALWFGFHVQGWILCLLLCCHLLWLYLGFTLGWGIGFYGCWFIGALIIVHQHTLVKKALGLRAFSQSVWYGLVMWVGLIL